MAPEQPPQLMDTLNLYWWSDMASEVGKLEPRGCGEE